MDSRRHATSWLHLYQSSPQAVKALRGQCRSRLGQWQDEAMDPFAAVPNGARHELLAELAQRGPLHHLVLPTTVPAWVITGYAQARAAFADPRLVKGGSRNAPFVDELEPETSAGLNNHMLTADPPTHTRLRKLVSTAFTRRQVERLSPKIQALTASLLDDVAKELSATGEADLVATFAYQLPITVICDPLGIQQEAS